MSKEVQMSIKMESELREQFMATAASRHRPAAQIVRDLMRFYIAQSEMSGKPDEIPNKLTAATLRKSERGEDIFHAKNAADLFRQLGI